MEDNETIDLMFGRFQTIINNFISLGKTYDNYNHITKILRSLFRKWRPQVTALRASKDLKKLPMMNSSSFQGRSNICRSIRYDQYGRTTLESTLRK
ncbi:hypothetical protein CR513_04718, partial [Mucuna pruriens]